MIYSVEHTIVFRDGTKTAPYRLDNCWKTIKGALRAGEKHAEGVGRLYNDVSMHSIVVKDDTGHFVTNEAT